jgi:Fur family ferric uptake transcriptional regulator
MIFNYENPMQIDRAALTAQLNQHGYKLTRQRKAVVEVMTLANTRLTTAEVFAKAQRECPDLGLTTVYRTLEILEQLGAIRRVHLEDGCEAFASTAIEHGHYLICANCQTTIEFEGCDLTDMLDRIARQTGFTIDQHWLELVGRCPKCQKKK